MKEQKRKPSKNKINALIAAIILVVGVIYFPDLFADDETAPVQGDRIPVKLVRTIDGDTIKIMYEGREQNVRYLLIDTPETNHPQLGKQPFGQQAKTRNQELLQKGQLEIEFDVGQKYDKYDRLLAYIYVDGKSVQEQLLKEGLARVAYVYPPNTRHLDAFENAQQQAKKAGIGIWTLEDYVTDHGFDSEKHPHKDQAYYFKNCTELRKQYPDGVKKGHPAYAERLDRNRDGWACE